MTNVVANDTLDAGPAAGAVALSVVSADAGVTLNPATGSIVVAGHEHGRDPGGRGRRPVERVVREDARDRATTRPRRRRAVTFREDRPRHDGDVDAGLVAGTDRDPQSLRRVERAPEIAPLAPAPQLRQALKACTTLDTSSTEAGHTHI